MALLLGGDEPVVALQAVGRLPGGGEPALHHLGRGLGAQPQAGIIVTAGAEFRLP